MRRSTLVLILFALIAAGVIAFSQFLQNQPPLTVTIAVDPLAQDWLEAATSAFNASSTVTTNNRRIQITLNRVNEVDVWTSKTNWTVQNHPTAWMPASTLSLEYIPSNQPFQTVKPSTARTLLVWGGFASRVQALTQNGQRPFEWGAVADAAQGESWQTLGVTENWGFIQMGLNNPNSSTSGLAVLLSAAANYGQSATITSAIVNDAGFRTWFSPIHDSMRNSLRRAGLPVQTMTAQGAATINFALFPENQWLMNLSDLAQREAIILDYPAYQVVFDFPLAVWQTPQTSADELEAINKFGDYLLSQAGQALAQEYGLRPVLSEPTPESARFVAGLGAGIQLEPDYGLAIRPASRNEADALLRLINS